VPIIDVKPEGLSAHEVLAWSRTAVEPALRAAVGTLPSSMRRIAGYHFGWWNEHGQPYRAPEKARGAKRESGENRGRRYDGRPLTSADGSGRGAAVAATMASKVGCA
jgi:hypothetical protein